MSNSYSNSVEGWKRWCWGRNQFGARKFILFHFQVYTNKLISSFMYDWKFETILYFLNGRNFFVYIFLFLGFCTKTNSKDFCHSSCTDCFTLCTQLFPFYSFLCAGMLSTSFPSVRIDDCLFHLIFTAAYSAYEVYLSFKWLRFKANAVGLI